MATLVVLATFMLLISRWKELNFLQANKVSCITKLYLFRDTEIASKILLTKRPMDAKKLGRKIDSFDQKVWDETKYSLVYNVVLNKFKQDVKLGKQLKETGDKTLVEASPYDKIWGIGISADDKNILNPMSWKGQNLLGKILMDVRKNL